MYGRNNPIIRPISVEKNKWQRHGKYKVFQNTILKN